MWHGSDPQVDHTQSLGPNLAALDLLLESRLCNSLEASGGGLWTLPSPGLPDHILRSHVDDEGLRTLRAFFGAKIFAQAVPPTIEQIFTSILRSHVDDEGLRTLRAFFGAKIFAQAVPPTIEQIFTSYPGNVRAVIEAQIAKPAVLSRVSARLPIYAHKVAPIIPTAGNCSVPKVQLLYAALSTLSEQQNSDYVTEWLKVLVGNMVPIIMDTVSDWEDSNGEEVERTSGEPAGTETGKFHLTIIDDDDQLEGRSNFALYEGEDDPDRLAELLANHLTELDVLDKQI
ncbi:unnamed protein product [Rhizoctonia solani]|uniref:Uncharacterized protein n=1 Tax=Rhizoctonia solani TaxID=456999 RepID=A0A8H3CFD6_9AGAM|nr:unnamed protein product [Rhizoctonia solani]